MSTGMPVDLSSHGPFCGLACLGLVPGQQGAAGVEGGPGSPGDLPAVSFRIGDERRAAAPPPVGRLSNRRRAGGNGCGERRVDLVPGVDRTGEGDPRPSGRVGVAGGGLGGQITNREERQQDTGNRVAVAAYRARKR